MGAVNSGLPSTKKLQASELRRESDEPGSGGLAWSLAIDPPPKVG